MENTLKKIEDAVLDHLKSNFPDLGEFDIGKDFANILTKTAVTSVTTEQIDIKPVGSGMLATGGYELHPVISVYVMFKSMKPVERRQGVYPMITAAAALLVGRDFGLDIEPLEPAGPIVEIFNQAIGAGGMTAFKLAFKTAFELDLSAPGEMTRLLVTANDYLYRGNEFETQVINYKEDI